MVMLNEAVRERVCQLRDEVGHPIGRIVQPRGPEVVGRHVGTVLLSRDLPRLHFSAASARLRQD